MYVDSGMTWYVTYSSLSFPDAHVLGEIVAVHQREFRQEVLDLCIAPASSRQSAIREQRVYLFRTEAEGGQEAKAKVCIAVGTASVSLKYSQ